MPEIWLRYGTTDVVLDIKYENLLKHISSNFQLLTDDEIRLYLSDIVLNEHTVIFALSDSKSVAKVITILVEMARAKGLANITINVLPKVESALRNNIADNAHRMKQINYESFHNAIGKFQTILFISQTTYDPLFGFGGSPTVLLRNYMNEHMSEAFNARQDNLPKPGVKGSPLKIALSNCESIAATSIELIANSFGIAKICYGNIVEAFQNAVTQLQSISTTEVQQAKSAIISSSSELGRHMTLADSLNSLWNILHIVKENGSAILLSENRQGIGGGALQMFIEGRLKVGEEQQKSRYIEGLEHLLYIREFSHKLDLGIVSTLPQYYSETKLGLKAYASMKEVMKDLLIKHGKDHKVLVLSDPDIIFLKGKL